LKERGVDNTSAPLLHNKESIIYLTLYKGGGGRLEIELFATYSSVIQDAVAAYVNIETEELLLWKYVENVEDDEPDFDDILRPYFEVLQSGLKH
jgi:hypothetical protein